jgi:predicted HNH restriction endonuclease
LANKLKAIALLGGKCSACDYQLHPSALQFHHVGSDKDKHISYLLHCSGKSQQLIAELDKCCLLCSNCHDAFHFGDLRLEFEKASLGFNVIRRSNDYV